MIMSGYHRTGGNLRHKEKSRKIAVKPFTSGQHIDLNFASHDRRTSSAIWICRVSSGSSFNDRQQVEVT